MELGDASVGAAQFSNEAGTNLGILNDSTNKTNTISNQIT